MPREGYKSITVSDSVYDDLSEIAEKRGLSIPQLLEKFSTKKRVEVMAR